MTLRVKIEIVPFGDETKVREIGRMDIFNTLVKHTDGQTAYGVINLTRGQEGLYNHPVWHTRSHGAWELVAKAIRKFTELGEP